MFGDEPFDNSAIDLDRVRKLAGLPETGETMPPADTFDAEDTFDLGDEDLISADLDVRAIDTPVDPAIAPAPPVPMPVPSTPTPAPEGDPIHHWSSILANLESQMDAIPVGEFREIIDSLRRLANYAEDIRHSLVTEGRKSLRDYVLENLEENSLAPIKPSSTGGSKGATTLGANRNDAVKSLHARMGGKPQDMQRAQQVFTQMQSKGKIRQKGSDFEMDTMDDEEFTSVVNDPMLN